MIGSVIAGKFSMTHTEELNFEVEIPIARLSPAPKKIEDVRIVWPDYFNQHYSCRFHDCTVLSYANFISTSYDLSKALDGIDIVTDRKSLRKLATNYCITLKNKPFYCKKENFELISEKVNGIIYIGGKTRYEESIGSYGRGFEQVVAPSSGPITTHYRLVKYKIGDVSVLVRFEADCVDSTGHVIELKSKKEPNPRYGLGEDFFMSLWLQMLLSDTGRVVIGLHNSGNVSRILDYTLQRVQEEARITDRQATDCLHNLSRTLKQISELIPEGRQADILCSAVLPPKALLKQEGTYPLPMFSAAIRQKLQATVIEKDAYEDKVKSAVTATEKESVEEVTTPTVKKVDIVTVDVDSSVDTLTTVFTKSVDLKTK